MDTQTGTRDYEDCPWAGGLKSQSLTASPAPGLAEVQAWVRPLGAFPRRGGRLGQLPSPVPACPAAEFGCQRPFCLCKQLGLGVWPGLTQRSVLSLRAGREARPVVGRGHCGSRSPGSSVCKPVNPSPAWLAFLVPIGPDSSTDPSAPLLGKAAGIPPRLGHKCQCGKSHRRSRLLGSFRT